MADLTGINLKIERTDQYITNLADESEGFNERCQCTIVDEFDPKTRRHVYRLSGTPPRIDKFVTIKAGEAIHHLRSALDHLVYQLAVREAELNGTTVTDSTQRGFPVFQTRPTTEKQKTRFAGKVQGLSPEAIALIERLQPYNATGGKPSDVHFLIILDQLDITDKHRLLLVVAEALNIVSVTIGKKNPSLPMTIDRFDASVFRKTMPAEDGAEIGVAFGCDNMKVNIQTTFDIAFNELGSPQLHPIVPTLQQLRDLVVRLIESFEKAFF